MPYGKSNLQLRCELAVFRRQWAVNRKDTAASVRLRLESPLNDVPFAEKHRGFFFECINFPMSARTAIRHGLERVLKIVVDEAAKLYRWADAAPLAECEVMFIIRCPEIWSRDRAARGR